MSERRDPGPFGRNRLARLRGRLFHLWFLLRRPMTLGVRALVVNEAEGTVFLVRHTYVAGWQLPGGGVETGETLVEALRHELIEECNIEMRGAPRLAAMYYNRAASRRDHVALYVVSDFHQTAPKQADREIAEAAFFRLDALPEGTTRATRARLAEQFEGRAPSPYW
ncbi:NUDIX domain-containing protein [Aquibium sp. ELW1220]|uniref:NUDIX domain-containing protein n=1 Tax=Aquibium sp. ELW1220 TaxID=2976766 RepID=UPI0025B05813|nr:NUDIX domain-containing protein [Aquibium sp. ELW1220]MDN2579413.1 NUDIX domain-containing protein [Aquibium sp. ELW1220]